MDKRLILGLIVLSLVFLMGASGCGSYTQPTTVTPPAATTPPAETATQTAVTISGFAFDPAEITVKAGDTVTWTNQDSVQHKVVSDNGIFEGPAIGQGMTYSFTFATAGTYTYHCGIHPSMKGTVTVQ